MLVTRSRVPESWWDSRWPRVSTSESRDLRIGIDGPKTPGAFLKPGTQRLMSASYRSKTWHLWRGLPFARHRGQAASIRLDRPAEVEVRSPHLGQPSARLHQGNAPRQAAQKARFPSGAPMCTPQTVQWVGRMASLRPAAQLLNLAHSVRFGELVCRADPWEPSDILMLHFDLTRRESC
jgi:hypothetical protein